MQVCKWGEKGALQRHVAFDQLFVRCHEPEREGPVLYRGELIPPDGACALRFAEGAPVPSAGYSHEVEAVVVCQ